MPLRGQQSTEPNQLPKELTKHSPTNTPTSNLHSCSYRRYDAFAGSYMPSVLIRSRSDPEPSTLFGPGEPISQWRKEEIHALPQELRTQCLLTMQTRKRQAAQIPDRSLITTPQEVTAATSQESATVRCMFGSDINASCFAERERARQMEILMVMWSRGFVRCWYPYCVFLG